MENNRKPTLSFWQIWNISFGFFGIQYGFGLQQANLSPIFRYLGADEHQLPILWLAGPITGLIVQPIIGALSDKTWNRFGRRKPFFMMGAIVGSVAVLCMPYSPYLWVAVGLFWILDAAMNTAMEPYRALVADQLPKHQHSLGFSIQTFMIAFGQILAGLMPLTLLYLGVSDQVNGSSVPEIVKVSFVIGVFAILGTAIWTWFTTDEHPPSIAQLESIRGDGRGIIASVASDLSMALKHMPKELWKLWWIKLFSWIAMPIMWQYLALSIARHAFSAPTPESEGFVEGTAWVGTALTVMNLTTLFVSFCIPKLSRVASLKSIYGYCLLIGGIGFVSMLLFPSLEWTLICMVLVGIGWAAIVSVPFMITASVVPENQMGIYMGILNAFICVPQIISMILLFFIYEPLLVGDPRNALALAGVCLLIAGSLCSKLEGKK